MNKNIDILFNKRDAFMIYPSSWMLKIKRLEC